MARPRSIKINAKTIRRYKIASVNKKTTNRKRTAKQAKKFQLKWWMAVGLVGIVAVVGVVVVRFSRAGQKPAFYASDFGCPTPLASIRTVAEPDYYYRYNNGSCVTYLAYLMHGYRYYHYGSYVYSYPLLQPKDFKTHYSTYRAPLVEAVKDFQRRNRLPANGAVDSVTWHKLLQVCYEHYECTGRSTVKR